MEPVVLRKKDVAALLGWSVQGLRDNLPRLQDAGFPAYDEVLRGYSKPAVEAWLDARRGAGLPKPQRKDINYDAL